MKIAYILFDGITLLDLIGFYDPVSRLKTMHYLPDLTWDLCGMAPIICDNFGFKINCDQVQPDLGKYDMIVVPGGFGTRNLQTNQLFMQWLQAAKPVRYKVSVCTGSLLFGAAGFLEGKSATTNFQEYESLKKYGCEVLTSRIVDDEGVITAGAVSASIDLGLYICEKLAGKAAKESIRKKMDYHRVKFDLTCR